MKRGGFGQMVLLGFLGCFLGMLVSQYTGINKIACVVVGLTAAIMVDTYLSFFKK